MKSNMELMKSTHETIEVAVGNIKHPRIGPVEIILHMDETIELKQYIEKHVDLNNNLTIGYNPFLHYEIHTQKKH